MNKIVETDTVGYQGIKSYIYYQEFINLNLKLSTSVSHDVKRMI